MRVHFEGDFQCIFGGFGVGYLRIYAILTFHYAAESVRFWNSAGSLGIRAMAVGMGAIRSNLLNGKNTCRTRKIGWIAWYAIWKKEKKNEKREPDSQKQALFCIIFVQE